MTVLKEGDCERAKQSVLKTRKFECDFCGCVFEANRGEYKSASQYNCIDYFCKCPCCGYRADEVKMRN